MIDNNRMSALHHLTKSVGSRVWWGDDTQRQRNCADIVAALLTSGADVLGGDSCLCACSVSGCIPTSRLFYTCRSFFDSGVTLSTIPWLLEWYILLKHLKPPEVLHQALPTLFRFQEFEELWMTHTCCAKKNKWSWVCNEKFDSPWQDEI
jgi:hypothetical protein